MICPFNVAPGLAAFGYCVGGDVDGTPGVHGETVVGYGYTGVGNRTRCANELLAKRQTPAITSEKFGRFVRGGNAEGRDNMLRLCDSVAERQLDRRGCNNLPDSTGQDRFAACIESTFGTA